MNSIYNSTILSQQLHQSICSFETVENESMQMEENLIYHSAYIDELRVLLLKMKGDEHTDHYKEKDFRELYLFLFKRLRQAVDAMLLKIEIIEAQILKNNPSLSNDEEGKIGSLLLMRDMAYSILEDKQYDY